MKHIIISLYHTTNYSRTMMMNRKMHLTFGIVMNDLKKNTRKIIATSRYSPLRVSLFGDEDYLEKPAPAITATYIKNEPFEKMEIKTKDQQDFEEEETWQLIIDRCTKQQNYTTSTTMLNYLDNPNDYLSELMYIPLEESNLSEN